MRRSHRPFSSRGRRQLRRLITLGAALTATVAAFPAASASADVAGRASASAPDSTGQEWALKSEANGKYVTTEATAPGARSGKLRASGDQVGSPQRFTLHTTDRGTTVSLRSVESGGFASAEVNDPGHHYGMLRARAPRIGGWEKFELVSQGGGRYSLKSQANGKYVSAEVSNTGNDYGLLRARADRAGAWERFTLEAVNTATSPPPPAPARSARLQLMTWNVCGNNNTHCGNYRVSGEQLAAELASRLRPSGETSEPDAVFLQEFCEKQAVPVQKKLEKVTGRTWRIGFAPITYKDASGQFLLRKQCDTSKDGTDRGAYGVALAMVTAPGEGASFQHYDLPSPESSPKVGKTEQRTALCAAVPSRALHFCTAHFSAGGPNYDDTDGRYRRAQAEKLLQVADQPGYRPVLAGDFNVVPPDAPYGESPFVLEPVYARYRECAQLGNPGAPRDGTPTLGGGHPIKIDYLFAPKNAPFASCALSPDIAPSDHHTLYGTVTIPAT